MDQRSPARLHLLHVLEPAVAGVPAYVDQLGRHLADFGLRQTVVVGGQDRYEHWPFDEWAEMVHRPRWNRRSLDTVRIAQQLRDVVDQGGIDIVHAHSTIAGIASRLRRLPVPVVYQPHGWGAGSVSTPAVATAIRLVERALSGRADRLLLLSTQEEAESVAGVATTRVRPIVDVARFGPSSPGHREQVRKANGWPSTSLVYLCVGELSNRKNQVALAREWRQTAPPDRLLVLVGDGSTRDQVNQEAGGNVRVMGWRKDVAELMGAADAVVVASKAEGFALVIVEALVSGLPMFTTPVGGSETITESDGTVTEDLDQLVRSALSSDLVMSTYEVKVARATRNRQQFSAETAARQIMDVYLEVDRSHPRRDDQGHQLADKELCT